MGAVVGVYIVVIAVVPDLRGRDGGLAWRAFTTALFWATTIGALFLLWRAGL